jgi:hypothetical protein
MNKKSAEISARQGANRSNTKWYCEDLQRCMALIPGGFCS